MQNTRRGIVQSQILQARSCCNFLIEMTSKFLHHSAHSIHYSFVESGDVLDILVHKNITLSNVIVSDILDSDHLPIIFHILDHVRTKNVSAPLEKFTDWERFQSLAPNLISSRIEINSGVETGKAGRAFTASIASAYRLAPSKITLTHLNSDLPA
jgi:hypothetical protein